MSPPAVSPPDESPPDESRAGDPSVREPLPRTGDEAVDAALAELEQLGEDTPLAQHVVVLGEVHEALQRRLSATQG